MEGIVSAARLCDRRGAGPTVARPDGDFPLVKERYDEKTKANPARFEIGDWVTFPFGERNVVARVIEQRGALGIDQMHISRIRLELEDMDPDLFELSEDLLQPASPPV